MANTRQTARRLVAGALGLLLACTWAPGAGAEGVSGGAAGQSASDRQVPESPAASPAESSAQLSPPTPAGAESGLRTVVYYFHVTFRCPDCLMVERYVRDVLNADFGELLQDGLLLWAPIDYEQPENLDYVAAFDLGDGPALILTRWLDGEQVTWRNLFEVWELLDDPVGLGELIRGEIALFLEDAGPPADQSPEPAATQTD